MDHNSRHHLIPLIWFPQTLYCQMPWSALPFGDPRIEEIRKHLKVLEMPKVSEWVSVCTGYVSLENIVVLFRTS